MSPRLVRIPLDNPRVKELEQYLLDHWKRAHDGRVTQLDEHFTRWQRNFKAEPAQKSRSTPWPNASNIVIPVIRTYIDTFVARTLNIIFSTRPLFTIDGFVREEREALQEYFNRKALYEWEYYWLTREILSRGNKNGTVVVKTTWSEDKIFTSKSSELGTGDEAVSLFTGPRSLPIPFDDFFVYPLNINRLEEAVIKFHRIRLVEDVVRQRAASEGWGLEDGDYESLLEMPADVKRLEDQEKSGVSDPRLREAQLIECHLTWELMEGRSYQLVALLSPRLGKLVSLNHFPHSPLIRVFHDYRPFPQEDFFWGSSMAQILEGMQEEASAIHNDRRNNSYIANAPMFKRRNGSLIPNPSDTIYPGKVWDLESMEDFEVFNFGRNYDSMLDQEMNVFNLCDRAVGIGPVMQGYAQGMMGKRGIYNAQGTLAILSESNQRQDTNIRDARQVLGSIARSALALQAAYDPDDPTIEMFTPEAQAQIRAAMQRATPSTLSRTFFKVEASNAGANKEVERQNHLQMAQILAQYGNAVQQFGLQLANPQLNPAIRAIISETVKMQRWMATRLLRVFDEYDAEGVLPDVFRALGQPGTPPTGMEGGGPPELQLGPAAGNGAPVSREFLQAISQMAPAAGNLGAEESMGPAE